MLSERVRKISPSLTLAISGRAKQMIKEGLDVVGFGAGEPDFDTPLHIREKAREAIEKGFTRYTPVSGLPELKEAIVRKFKRDNGLEYHPDQILVGCGAKHVLFEIIFSLIEPGDKVLIPSPYWLSYPEMVKVAGGECVFIRTQEKDKFKVTPEVLKKNIFSGVKLFIFNSPSNPTGSVYTREELKEIAEVLVSTDVICISDEIYEKLTYNGISHTSIASLNKELKERTIVVNGVSKAYAMTGWRIGYAAGPREIIKAATSLQSHSTSNPTSISQIAAISALDGPQKEVANMQKEFKRRRDFMLEKINNIQGLRCIKPEGTFYCFINISQLLGKRLKGRKIEGSVVFSELLLEEEKVAVVPGLPFGRDDYIRLSYATSLENIEKGLERIERFISKLD